MTKALQGKRHLDIDLVLDEDQDNASAAIVDENSPVALEGSNDSDVIDEDINPLDKLPDVAVLNSDGTVTMPLNYPVTLTIKKGNNTRKQVYSELLFHRLAGADHRAISAASDQGKTIVAFSQSTKINLAVMNALWDRMDMSDIVNGGQVINHFLTSGPKTGL